MQVDITVPVDAGTHLFVCYHHWMSIFWNPSEPEKQTP